MDLRRTSIAAALALAAASSPPPAARADDKTPGKWHEDKVVGFRFRPLNEWGTVPPGTDPNDPKLGGYYSDAAKYDRSVKPECSVYGFKVPRGEAVATEPGLGGGDSKGGGSDPPKPPTEEEMREMAMAEMRFKSTRQVVDFLRDRYYATADQLFARFDEKKQRKLKDQMKRKDPVVKELKAGDGVLTVIDTEFMAALTNGELLEGKIVAGYIRNEEYEVGVVYQIPESEWKKYGQGVFASIRSLKFLEGEDIAAARKDLADALEGKTGDERWLEAIKRKVGVGWAHLQTRNYLLVFDKNVKPDLVRSISIQIEAIRKDVYEVLFPPDRPVTAISVVRVCKDPDQYRQYGGPGGSAGYWNSGEQELVFYQDGSKGGDSLRVLYHEAFHQFIFYSVGSISPHDWFNEGHGDYFSGHNLGAGGRFIPKPFSWRQGIIKGAMGSKTYIPLKMFVQYSHQQYYGPQIGQNYAQGWSLIWFLRGTKNPAWKDILPNYFTTLKGEVTKWVDGEIEAKKKDGSYTEGWRPSRTPDDVEESARKKALDAAFGSFGDRTWEKFEKEWKDFKY